MKKSDKPTVLLLIGGCLAAMLIFTFAWFGALKEIFSGYIALVAVVLSAGFAISSVVAIIGSEDPNKDKFRVIALVLAIFYCTWVGAHAADHKVKKEEGIAVIQNS